MSPETLTSVTALPIPVTMLIMLGLLAGVYRAARVLGLAADHRASLLVKTGALLGIWLVLGFWLGAKGVFREVIASTIPVLSIGIVLPVVIGLALLATSQTARDVLAATPPHLLIGIQVYRIVGGIFLVLLAQGRTPGVFAIPAGWGDVLVGVTAPIVAWLYRAHAERWRGLAVLWNVVGLADLVVAVTLGVLTAPGGLQRLALDAPNAIITSFPVVLIPALLVPASILLHLLSLRVLRVGATRELVAA
jgi:hypothetical protein